jgi:hypothetical protein
MPSLARVGRSSASHSRSIVPPLRELASERCCVPLAAFSKDADGYVTSVPAIEHLECVVIAELPHRASLPARLVATTSSASRGVSLACASVRQSPLKVTVAA